MELLMTSRSGSKRELDNQKHNLFYHPQIESLLLLFIFNPQHHPKRKEVAKRKIMVPNPSPPSVEYLGEQQ